MSKRILVVEDQEDNRQILRDLLTSAEFEVNEAENGEEGLAAAAVAGMSGSGTYATFPDGSKRPILVRNRTSQAAIDARL